MSHFTKIKTALKEAEFLKRALADLGYEVEEDATVQDFGGSRVRVELGFDAGGGRLAGFRKRLGEYELVGDFYGLKLKPEALVRQVSQRYAYHAVTEGAAAQGYQVVTEETLRDGSIRLVVERWDGG
jgi:hypothetical protein